MVVEANLQSKDVSDKYARLVNFIAREVVALYPYLGQKDYYFKRILEKDEQVTDLKEGIHRSLMDWNGKSYGYQFRDLNIGLNADTLEFLKIHQELKTPRQLELVCIFGSPQSTNARNNDKTLFNMAVDGVLEIK